MTEDHPTALEFRSAVEAFDGAAIRRVFAEHPELVEVVDAPWFPFATPALVHVARSGERDVIDALLDAGADPNAKSAWEAGPYGVLDRIVDSREVDVELADYFIERGALLDVHAAAGLGRMHRLREIIEAHPERVNERGPDGAAPLHLAATPEVAEYLLENGADIEQRCVDHSSTPIMWSVNGREDVTRFLADRGARTDLFVAALLNDVPMAEAILEREPDAINVRVSYGTSHEHLGFGDKYVWALDGAGTPHEVARRWGHYEVLECLLEKSPPAMVLLMASRSGDAESVAALLESDTTLLSTLSPDEVCASLCGSTAAAAVLLEAGADPDSRDSDDGATALHHGSWNGDYEFVNLLLDYGADVTLRDRTHGGTPVGWAYQNGQAELVHMYRQEGLLGLIDACWLGVEEQTRRLLAADPTLLRRREAEGFSALRTAAWFGHLDIVKLLLEQGADPDLKHPDTGKTARDHAAEQGHMDVVRLLDA